MKRMIESVMQRATIILVCVVLILAWGAVSALQMQRDYLPGINNTTLMVSLRASSYQADQIKRDITTPLEDAIRKTNGITNLETTSYDGGVLMNLYYPMDYDMGIAENTIKQALNDAALPDGVNKPVVTRLTSSTFPILSYSLTTKSNQVDDLTLRSTLQTDIIKQLKSVPGVADVQTVGGANRGYVVALRMKDLVANSLTLDDFNKSITADVPSLQGNIANVKASFPIKVEGWDLTEQQLNNLIIKNKDGNSVPLSAVASVSQSLTDVKTVSRTNGKASVMINVIKTPTATITDVAKHVKERVSGIASVKSGDVSMTLLTDRAHDLNGSLKGLVREGLLGCVFSMLCVLFFFRNVRSTLLIAITLPISLLATTTILKSMGVTLNILTVSGLIVAMGRIVDDAIVILDNMYRRVQENKGKPILNVLASAVVEMLPAIFASTATTVAVYVPIALVGGIIGASYAGFAWSVVIALLVSFFVAMLVIPAFAFMGFREPNAKAVTLEPLMKPLLQSALTHKKTVISISLILFVAAALFASQLPFSLLPSTASGQVAIKVELPKGTPLSEVDKEVKNVEDVLQNNTKIASYSATFGSSFTPQADDVFDQGGGFIQQPNVANLSIQLKNKKEVNSFIPALQSDLENLSKRAAITVTNQNIAGDDSTIKIMLTGADEKTLDNAAQLVRTKLADIQGLSVAGKTDLTNGIPKYALTIDKEKVTKAGIKPDDINKLLTRYMAKGKDFDISTSTGTGIIPVDVYIDSVKTGVVTDKSLPVYAPEQVLASLAAETIKGSNGQSYRLDQFASIHKSDAVSSIQERDGQPFSVVSVQIISSDLSKVSNAVDQSLKDIQLPSGVTYSLGGITQQVTQMIIEISIAIIVSILLVLLITSFVFKGWKAPFAVLISIPLALSGVVLALYAIHGQWNLAAFIGVLMLTGIVVTNGIVLIDKIERNRKEGLGLREAVVQGSLSRVRPIFMTAGTTVLTLIPLALSHSTDTVISQVLGIVVIGGMITSTLNSFVVIPIIYEWMQGKEVRNADLSINGKQV
ncbi:swarming motility protein SwrC [Paenibacillus baekrokdamisoli]|uniref:Swarming motility protein SwrC n=1 Tax=Paenibacillus baekrokdamisoli TaxID=1712516 RepID=A0A3G9IQ37_9BACL|nr:efflux RND transporter permease subunit [Paenibacillus baekrokdamisoli]MBB3072080.1 multidrug efflux pump subunit AcrB [Paenibacillus baekrokdamisoli]BBH20382.1 swarming motility protein SwrC [Paenibacillus baekrokdamisoli]